MANKMNPIKFIKESIKRDQINCSIKCKYLINDETKRNNGYMFCVLFFNELEFDWKAQEYKCCKLCNKFWN